MPELSYHQLGPYSDWVSSVAKSHPLFPLAKPGKRTQKKVLEVLSFAPRRAAAQAVRIERRWKKGGIEGEEITWSAGYGPRTKAWLLKPAGVKQPLPGVLALHDHGGFKYYGIEKIADDHRAPAADVLNYRRIAYGGRAIANELARRGFAVLACDVFLWGSRKFPLNAMAEVDRQTGRAMQKLRAEGQKKNRSIGYYDSCAIYHEHTVAKYCALLGTTLPGVISYEDRIAADYLATRRDVCNGRIGCMGLSGGGFRSGLLQATCNRIQAAVVVGAMSVSAELLDHNVASHTWLFYPAGWSRYGDWCDLVACRAPSPLLVQYDREDALFTPLGMEEADRRLAGHYRVKKASSNYCGQFYPGPHKFDEPMQEAAFGWLQERLG